MVLLHLGKLSICSITTEILLSKYAFAYKRDKMKEKISIKHRKQTNPSGFSKD